MEMKWVVGILLVLSLLTASCSSNMKGDAAIPLTKTSASTQISLETRAYECLKTEDEKCIDNLGAGKMKDAQYIGIIEGYATGMSITFENGESINVMFATSQPVPLRTGCIKGLEGDGTNSCSDAGCDDEPGFHCEVTKLKGCGCYRPDADPDWNPFN